MQNEISTKRTQVPKACDACRRRKVKCDGLCPCTKCFSTDLACTYNVPQKRGGNRGKVLNDLRAKQQPSPTATTFEGTTRIPHIENSSVTTTIVELPQDEFEALLNIYEDRIYTVVCLLDVSTLRAQYLQVNVSPYSRQLILAFCAYVANFGDFSDDSGAWSSYISLCRSPACYLDRAQHSQHTTRTAHPEPQLVYTSFFLYGAYAGQGSYLQAWYYLREATTLYLMLKSEWSSYPDWENEMKRRRLFWILFVSERAHSVRKNRPITLQITSSSPHIDEDTDPGLYYLTSLFRPLDERFFAVWNDSVQDCTQEWLLQLESDVRSALPPILNVSNEEIANIRISQLWLLIKLWELFPRFGFLSTDSIHECLTFRYPISIAKNLATLAMKLPIQSLRVHGVGMSEKVFDIACALADVLPFVQVTPSQLELNPVDYLKQLVLLLVKLPGGFTKFAPLLLIKVGELLPELMNPIKEAMDIQINFRHPMSPDSRFAYEEEVGQGLYAALRRAEQPGGKNVIQDPYQTSCRPANPAPSVS